MGLFLKWNDIVLRDRIEADLLDHRRWFTNERAWMDWDAPWEEDFTPQETEAVLEKMAKRLSLPPPEIRPALEVCNTEGVHVGVVNSYFIDDNPLKLAAGIGIRETAYQGKGYGRQALPLWLAYLFAASGRDILYTETWSGNLRMVRLAESCGFMVAERKVSHIQVRGSSYDGLAFSLTRPRLEVIYPGLVDLCKGLLL
jgi:RimJ/RimL family protein N-acetyltransferase